MLRLLHFICLLLVFSMLAPTVAKLTHNHEHFSCRAQHEKHLHSEHEHCPICDFEFSPYVSQKTYFPHTTDAPAFADLLRLIFSVHADVSHYSFLLRGPPAGTDTSDL